MIQVMTTREFDRIQKNISKLKSDVEQAKGKNTAAGEQLKILGYHSIEEAQEAFAELSEKHGAVHKQFYEEYRKFAEEYGERL